MRLFLSMLLLAALGAGCDKNKYPIEPVIELQRVSKEVMLQNGQDSSYIEFTFTDGDGDIGSDIEDHIFLRDSRTGGIVATYRLPDYVPTDGESRYRKGSVTIVARAQCCQFPDSSSCVANPNYPNYTDTMRYQIQVRDKAGNFSNVLETNVIVLQCQ